MIVQGATLCSLAHKYPRRYSKVILWISLVIVPKAPSYNILNVTPFSMMPNRDHLQAERSAEE